MLPETLTSRRAFLQRVGTGALVGTVNHFKSGISAYQPPPSEAATAEIPLRTGRVFQISSSEWPVYNFGWQTEATEGPAALERVRSAASYSFSVDGVELLDFDRAWTDITQSNSGRYELNWRYSTSPLSPGNHTFEFELEFPDPIRTRGSESRVWEGTYRFTDIYGVAPDSPQNEADSGVGRDPSSTANDTVARPLTGED